MGLPNQNIKPNFIFFKRAAVYFFVKPSSGDNTHRIFNQSFVTLPKCPGSMRLKLSKLIKYIRTFSLKIKAGYLKWQAFQHSNERCQKINQVQLISKVSMIEQFEYLKLALNA